MTRILSEK